MPRLARAADRNQNELRRRRGEHPQGQPAGGSRPASTRASKRVGAQNADGKVPGHDAQRAGGEDGGRRVSRSIGSGRCYLERSLAGGWENQHVKENREIPVSEELGYYQQHIADFEFPAKARWEQLMVNFDRFNIGKRRIRALAEMGNEVLRGADFAEVAKARSHGPTRFDGGSLRLDDQGSLVSKVIDAAIFSLPLGRMSQIIEDEKGFHIVRVIERVDAGRKPFLEAQTEIREKLRDEDIDRQKNEFMAKMKERTPVWTIFDSHAGAATRQCSADEQRLRRNNSTTGRLLRNAGSHERNGTAK